MSWRNNKRKVERYDNNRSFKKPRTYDSRFEIVHRVKAQKGVRSQLVLCHNPVLVDPMTILSNAIDRIKATLNIKNIGNDPNQKGCSKFALFINKENIVQGSYPKEDVAKKQLCELALENLKKTCFQIYRKIKPRDSPTVNVNSNAATSKSTPSPPNTSVPESSVGGIGAKMMLKMGWTGRGLGANEQGITEIIKPCNQIERQGFGTEVTIPVNEIRNILETYAASDDINSIAFSPDFSKEERAIIHSVAKKMNLKSSSYGKGEDRRLVIQKKINPWELIYSLLEIGGENEQYQLIVPTKFQ